MTDLSPAARELIRRVRESDGPQAHSKSKVQRKLATSLAGSGAMTGALRAASGAKATAAGWSAAIAGGAKIALVTAVVLSAGGIVGLSVYDSADTGANRRNVSPPATPLGVTGTPLTRAPSASGVPAFPSLRSADVEPDVSGTALPPRSDAAETPSAAPLPRLDLRLRTLNRAVKPSGTNIVASSATASTAPEEESLIAELTRLKAANQAIDSGSPDHAISLVEAPSQTFQAEFLAIRVLALCQKGELVAGTHWREIFLSRYGSSALAARVRGACLKKNQ